MKTALITGGSRGLGYALTKELLGRGYRVVVLDVLPFAPEEQVTFHRFDLADFDAACVEQFPQLDVVICNAGITAVGNFKDMAADTNGRVMGINAIGHMNLMKYILQYGKLNANGHVAFTSSAAAYVPWPVGVAYAASKAALDGFSKALESYLCGMKISVTMVYPGAMRTEHGGYAHQKGMSIGVEPAQIAPKIIRGILRRKRRMFPDNLGRMLVGASLICPKMMARWMYRKFEPDIRCF